MWNAVHSEAMPGHGRLQIYEIGIGRPMPLPLLRQRVRASPAEDFIESQIDLQQLLIQNRAATFLVRVAGDSMVEKGLGVRRVWKDGYRYSKAGVITIDRVPLAMSQRALIGAFDRERGMALMEAMDACNRRRGRGAVVPAAAGFAPRRTWSTKFEMRSPRYTTRVDELPVVRAA